MAIKHLIHVSLGTFFFLRNTFSRYINVLFIQFIFLSITSSNCSISIPLGAINLNIHFTATVTKLELGRNNSQYTRTKDWMRVAFCYLYTAQNNSAIQ